MYVRSVIQIASSGAMAVAVMLSTPLQAENEFYKWIDEKGETHYTQTPPPPSLRVKSETISVKARAGDSVVPREVDGAMHCGTTKLTDKGTDVVNYIHKLRRHVETWKKFEADIVKKDDLDSRRRLAESRCAIKWAEQELAKHAEEEGKFNSNYDKAMSELDDLKRRWDKCASPLEREEGETTESCRRPMSARMRELQIITRRLAPEKLGPKESQE